LADLWQFVQECDGRDRVRFSRNDGRFGNLRPVDYIVPLSGKPLSGTAQLHNDRTNFGNTTTMTLAPCASPLPAVVGPGGSSDAGADVQGNEAH
jgi:hypothetical protein